MMEDRYFSPDPAQRQVARTLYETVQSLPLICPHGHVEPRLLADPNYQFGSPVDLLIIPDHYIFRMLYSQGISLEALGIPRQDGAAVESDHRAIWQSVCDHWYLFRATPTGIWVRDELSDVFGIDLKMNTANAQAIYDAIEEKLAQPEFRPRAMFERFNIEVLATTDAATDTLQYHQVIKESGWGGRVVPTFRPDAVVNIDTLNWGNHIEKLSTVSGIDVTDYASYIQALEQRRAFFKTMGATATDHAATSAYTAVLTDVEAETIFQRALAGKATAEDAKRFTGHMLIEMARMSSEDGLVMQLHVGAYRDHNQRIMDGFGQNMGADIPMTAEFTRSLKPLLDRYGNHPDMTVVLFNLDETNYSRELAPLAGHYPILKLGPPWWFFDSLLGMHRYFDGVIETAGLYNTAGFNDDTRAYPSIPARHDVWRRASADWLADKVVRQIIDEEDAAAMIAAMAYKLAKSTYKL
ncbi:glucuronate isomerase [Phototrophicus methaneseepsis]|uniref:Uronate isomerase n=1 Tax=Phototrophicus methaneseepsis TaxID=2710758 RepID=A0A7S8EBY3_9CHLR|nr:glucuronate isomerase [Phototrophicus methaneseepsis]QPC84116.1 glucuronate isomerase [Phototrophicus methaneseepsis]